MGGDPYAALDYANYLRFNKLRIRNDRGVYIYNPDLNARDEAMKEVREFLVRSVNSGLNAGAILLSREYSGLLYYRVESLAWRKIAFAMGESENFDCLRDSTTCVVKDFNNLNRDEFFYPCVARALDYCTQVDQEDAALLALQYLNSLEFAINNVHRGVGR